MQCLPFVRYCTETFSECYLWTPKVIYGPQRVPEAPSGDLGFKTTFTIKKKKDVLCLFHHADICPDGTVGKTVGPQPRPRNCTKLSEQSVGSSLPPTHRGKKAKSFAPWKGNKRPSASLSLTMSLCGYNLHRHQGLRAERAETSPAFFRPAPPMDCSFCTMNIPEDPHIGFNEQETR